MRLRATALVFWLFTAGYIGALLWLDRRNGYFSSLDQLSGMFPALVSCAVLALVIRGGRWHWLLARAGHSYPAFEGMLAYFSGFAFTATPGKVGELARIRYFDPLGVAPPVVISAFVYERVLDVVVVFGLAVLGTWRLSVFPVVVGFSLLVLAIVLWLCRYPQRLQPFERLLKRLGWSRLARAVEWLGQALAHTSIWMKPVDLTVAISLGILGWGLTTVAFKLLLDGLGVNLPLVQSLSLYPAAMLAGAASMLPGGIGSTELTLVALLTGFDVPLVTATIAAIGIRLATLWLATALGLCALLALARMQTSGVNVQTMAGKQPLD